MKHVLIAGVAAMLVLACSRKTTTAAVAEPVEKSLSADALAGQTLYSANCGRCHDLPTVDHYSEKKWNNILPRMIKKAHLADDQGKQVTAYVRETLN